MKKFHSLRKKGHRITSQREKILKKIKPQPQTVEEIHESLERQVDITSVYRTLDLFVDNRLVREIDFGDGKKRYELSEDDNHHHHLICENCGNIEDFKMEEEKILENAKTQTDFLIKKHRLEFFGICKNCQS